MKATVIVLLAIFMFGATAPSHHSGEVFAQARRESPSKKGTIAGQKDSAISPRIPDAAVYDQNGKRLKFYTDLIKGKTVAINFIFTTCTTICPPHLVLFPGATCFAASSLTATFRRVQQGLGERVGQDVQLISISVDPTTDVPERMKAYADKFKAGPGWTFVTGDKAEIDSLLTALGTAVANKNDHTPMILIGNDSAGYWTRAYGLSSPSQLVEIIKDTASRNSTRSE